MPHYKYTSLECNYYKPFYDFAYSQMGIPTFSVSMQQYADKNETETKMPQMFTSHQHQPGIVEVSIALTCV